jgi:hypothetical protein
MTIPRVLRAAAVVVLATCASFGGCFMRDPTPRHPQLGPAGGYAPLDFDASIACGSWDWATADLEAKKHVTFPEPAEQGCFARVGYASGPERVVAVSPPAEGCAYPRDTTDARLLARAAVYEAVASGAADPDKPVPLELACELPDSVRRAAAAANARTLRSLATALAEAEERPAYPYALVGTFGFGAGSHGASKLVGWRPGDACRSIDAGERALLEQNVQRAERAAAAYHAGAAPLVSVSGGAVHSPLVEAFMLTHLVSCDGGVPVDRILVDPCADHTHTNVRNTGSLVVGVDGRFAYLVTDDGIQSDYLQEWTAFELIGGSIDQRARRDWGHLVGSWRQASRGIDAGFWFTPYRFWADPEQGLGSFHCVGDKPIDGPS